MMGGNMLHWRWTIIKGVGFEKSFTYYLLPAIILLRTAKPGLLSFRSYRQQLIAQEPTAQQQLLLFTLPALRLQFISDHHAAFVLSHLRLSLPPFSWLRFAADATGYCLCWRPVSHVVS